MNKYLTFFFHAFIFLSIVLQGHGAAIVVLNVFPLACFFAVLVICFHKVTISPLLIITTLYFALLTLLYLWVGYKDPYIEPNLVLRHGLNVTITIAIIIIGMFLHENDLLDVPKLFYVMITGIFCYIIVKLIAVSLIFMGVISLKEFLSFMHSAFNVSLVPGRIAGSFVRLQTSMDIIPLFLMLFVLSYNRWNPALRFSKLFFVLVVLNTIVAYSRVQLVVLLLPLTYYYVFFFTARRKLLILFSFIIAIILSYDVVSIIIEDRFFSSSSSQSDQTRVVQAHFLIDKWLQRPLFGFGLGGYDWRLIRDNSSLYSYEVQWLQILMQFGIIGISLFLAPFIYLLNKAFIKVASIDTTSYVIAFIGFLLMGFTNPYLIGRPAGIVFLLFWLHLVYQASDKEQMQLNKKEREADGKS